MAAQIEKKQNAKMQNTAIDVHVSSIMTAADGETKRNTESAVHILDSYHSITTAAVSPAGAAGGLHYSPYSGYFDLREPRDTLKRALLTTHC